MKRLGRLRVAVGVLSMCFGAGSVVEAQKPIRIGASLSLTGAYAALGQNQHRGYQLCVKHTNDKGGALGRRLELVLHDDWWDPATAVRLYEKLITRDKVDLILGPYGPPITQAVADVAEKHQVPMLTHASATSIFKTGGSSSSSCSRPPKGSWKDSWRSRPSAASGPWRSSTRTPSSLKMDLNTVFGPFKVDPDGFQIAHRMLMFQWQNGRKVILWPEELAPGKPRFPTPPWSERR